MDDVQYTIRFAITEEGDEIAGIPHLHLNNQWGEFRGKFPQVAAKKAYSSIIKYIKKYPTWFADTDIKPNQPLIIIIERDFDEENFIYYVYRKRAPQSAAGPRNLISPIGREMSFMWRNIAIPMKEGETVEDAIIRHTKRSYSAKNRKS